MRVSLLGMTTNLHPANVTGRLNACSITVESMVISVCRNIVECGSSVPRIHASMFGVVVSAFTAARASFVGIVSCTFMIFSGWLPLRLSAAVVIYECRNRSVAMKALPFISLCALAPAYMYPSTRVSSGLGT